MSWDATSPTCPHMRVVGDAMSDRDVMGGTRRISREAPVPVVRASRLWAGKFVPLE
jgi:D-beta-D-heptose 7-phosphate kinase/D-beta-D-heptose 1-phosphate adenosyltransferase